jgi:ankyrin repeat protein
MSAESSPAFNLEHLKKDAKRLLRACRAGEPGALSSVRSVLPRLQALSSIDASDTIKLADVHQALAVQRGFVSWADLTRVGDPLAALLTAVRGGHLATFRRQLPRFAGLAVTNVFAAAALGDTAALRLHVDREPSYATRSHEGWTALDYVCSSPLGRLSTRHATNLIDCAELLLDAGADPGSAVEDGRMPGGALPAIARAMLAGNIGLVVILKKHGADEPHHAIHQWFADHRAEDGARLHEAFSDYFRRPDVRAEMQKSLEAFRTERGITAASPDGLLPTDPRDLQHLRMPNLIGAQSHLWSAMLDRGYDPAALNVSGRTALHMLVTYAPASFLQMFLERGVNLNVRDADGRSVIATAVRAGNSEAAGLLRSRGVADDSTLADRLIGACLADDAEAAQELVTHHPQVLQSLSRADADEFVRAAARGAIGQVRLMLACGFPPDFVGESGATALQQAAWRGQVPVVELLLAHGASTAMTDELYGEAALDWARHGAAHAQGAEGPCLEAARLLAGRAS